MGKIVIFGAGGRAGRAAVAEAGRRGHRVTAVVRDPGKYADLVVLNQKLFEVPTDRISDTTVVQTILGGKVVYSAE